MLIACQAKKLALNLTISLLMNVTSIKTNFIVNITIKKLVTDPEFLIRIAKAPPLLLLKCVPYIYHLIRFKKNQAKVKALIDFGSKVNIITLAYLAKLDLKVRPIYIKTQKIDCFTFQMLRMLMVSFQIDNKCGRS